MRPTIWRKVTKNRYGLQSAMIKQPGLVVAIFTIRDKIIIYMWQMQRYRRSYIGTQMMRRQCKSTSIVPAS
ncbi:MAG: hypothetical protein ABIY51_12595 [Ferruginibacter sp.]